MKAPTFAEKIDDPRITGPDRFEILSFQRFLSEAGQVGPTEAGRIPREWPGWVPYCLGTGPPPPEGLGATPITAWPWPSHDPPLEANRCWECGTPVLTVDFDAEGDDGRGLPTVHRSCARAFVDYAEAEAEGA